MSPSTFAGLEGFDSVEARKKRLGQYFSGQPVAKLLVALAARRGVRSVCDPMGGRGDMLIASRTVIPGCTRTDGIEIDPIAHGIGAAALLAGRTESTYLLGSAFEEAIVSGLSPKGYDLVVTNPPYVRYQSQKVSAGQSTKLPSALDVRNGLRACLAALDTLTTKDRQDFLTLAESYSGLSDLAVPAWILCAALVRPGGTLAMVVPEAWLSRDYASVVRYLLLRWFRMEYIIEDAHAAWFADAQVKTTLLVARRVDRLESVGEWKDETYLHVSLPSQLANDTSLVGRSALDARRPELAFAREARKVAEGASQQLVQGATWHRVRIADQVAALTRSAGGEAWFRRLEQLSSIASLTSYVVPPVLAPWFSGYEHLTTLSELGIEIGQGLRTGANGFFYADVISRTNTQTTIASRLLQGQCVKLPSGCALPVVRKQADVYGTMAVDRSRLAGVALAFHGWALPEHAAAASALPLPDAVATYIRRAAEATVGEKVLPSLTAVAPNTRKGNPGAGLPARFWYMLPEFAPRHRPDLFVARVNSETPRVTLNPGREVLVDANFSTLWMKPGALVDVHAIFAYLNSSVAAALFEHTGAVMGGGALKLEATHLRSLPAPTLSTKDWRRLKKLGSRLAAVPENQRKSVVQEIDATLCSAMFGIEHSASKVMELHVVINNKQTARTRSHDARTRSSSADLYH